MKETDQILIQLLLAKLKKEWTDDMMSSLAFEIEAYLMDKDLMNENLDEKED